ncbi:MAG: AAA-like domain-containing protein, partial [Clostridiales bacterium]|nr:AAA-like domain-containing protein [Clostridiales bacterium]
MGRIFNVAGPCNPQDHYMIDAVRRLGAEVFSLIQDKQYFVIHAARQTGKTTLLRELTRRINAEEKYYALYCSLEKAQGIADPEKGILSVVGALREKLDTYGFPHASAFGTDNAGYDYSNILQRSLRLYCAKLDKPLVVFFDEADALSDQTLISFLRQLRDGYVDRPDAPFVHSLGLIGMRNIRDYRDQYRAPEKTLGSSSPFNIVTSTMTLRNFTQEEIAELYAQHTADTGQVFEKAAVELVWRQTQGQPWLVNAIAREAVQNITRADPRQPITADMIETAIQTIILQRGTHFDSLMARLREERIQRVIEPIITGEANKLSRLSDDYHYAKDMGLIRNDRGKVEIANPIYAEVVVRTLNWDTQQSIEERGYPYQMPRYIKEDGTLDMDFLLRDFQSFWRENAAIWHEKYDYKEAAPQLVMLAFLQRVVNGGGRVLREMAAETRRVDLCV